MFNLSINNPSRVNHRKTADVIFAFFSVKNFSDPSPQDPPAHKILILPTFTKSQANPALFSLFRPVLPENF